MIRALWEKAVTFCRQEDYSGKHRFARNIEYYTRIGDVKVIIHNNLDASKRAIASLQRDLQKRQRRNSYGLAA